MLFQRCENTHIVIVCVCYFWFAIDVFYSLWQGCDSLNHNSTFEKKTWFFNEKEKKPTKYKLFNKYNAIYKEITQSTPKDRSEKHVSNI